MPDDRKKPPLPLPGEQRATHDEPEGGLFGGDDLDEGQIDGLFDSLIAPESDLMGLSREVEVVPDELPPAPQEDGEGTAPQEAPALGATAGGGAPEGSAADAPPTGVTVEPAYVEALAGEGETVEERRPEGEVDVEIDFEAPDDAGGPAPPAPKPLVREGTLREMFGFRGAVAAAAPTKEENTPVVGTPAPPDTPMTGPTLAPPVDAEGAAETPGDAAAAAPGAGVRGPIAADFLEEEEKEAPARRAPPSAPPPARPAPPAEGAPGVVIPLDVEPPEPPPRPAPPPAGWGLEPSFHDDAVPAPPTVPRDTMEAAPIEQARWEELVALYEAEIELTRDRGRLVTLHYEAARTLGDRLAESERADRHLDEALKLNPRHRPSLQMLRRSHVGAQRWSEALKLIDVELSVIRDPQEASLLHLRKGRILEFHTEQPSDAAPRAAYERARDTDRTNRSANAALADLAYARGDWKSLITLHRAEAEHSPDSAERAAIELEMAAVDELVLHDAKAAAAEYGAALGHDAALAAASFGLVRLARARADAGAEADALEADAALAGDPPALARRLWAASLAAGRGRDGARADALLAQAAVASPAAPALAALVESHALAGRDAERVEALRALAGVLAPGAARAELHLEAAATLAARLGKPEQALEQVERATANVPDHVVARQLQLRLLHGARRHVDLAKAWEDAAGAASGLERTAALLVAADLRERLAGDTAAAAEDYARALAQSADDPLALDGARRLWEGGGNAGGAAESRVAEGGGADGEGASWKRLAGALRTASQHTSDAQARRALLLWSAELWERRGAEAGRDAALAAYGEVTALVPNDPEALGALARLHAAAGDEAEHARALQAMADAVQQTAAGEGAAGAPGLPGIIEELRYEAGRSRETAGALDEARALYERAAASPGAALAHERLLAASGKSDALLAVRRRALEALGEDGDPAARAALHLHLGEICEVELQQPDEALAHYKAARAAAPADLDAARAVARRYREAGDHAAWARALTEDARLRTDTGRRVAGLLQAGDLHERRLADPDLAAALYREALAADPGSYAAHVALHDLCATRGDAAALAALYAGDVTRLEQAGAGTARPHDLAQALIRQARWVRMDPERRAEALALARRAHALTPDLTAAVRFQETLAARLADWPAWCEAQERLAARFTEPLDALDYLIGGALAKQAHGLGDGGTAAAARGGDGGGATLHPALADLRAALALSPENPAVHLWLYTLARATGDDGALAEALDRMAASAPDAVTRAALLTRLGDLRPDAAEVLWRQALQAHEGYLPAIKRLRRRADESKDGEALAAFGEAEGRASADTALATAAWLRAGIAAAGPLRDAARARRAFAEVLERDPGNDMAFESLVELLTSSDDPAALRDALTRRAEAVRETGPLTALLLQLGELCRDRLNARAEAKRAFSRVVQIDAANLAALAALGDLHFADGEWQEAASAAARLIKLSTHRPVLRLAYARLGTIYADHLVDLGRAVECFRRAASLSDGADTAPLERLVELHRRQGDFAASVEVGQRLVAAATEPRDRIRHHLALATVHEEGRQDPKTALMEVRRALQIDPGDLAALEALAGLFERAGNARARQMELERAAQIYLARVKAQPVEPLHYRGLLQLQIWSGARVAAAATAEALEVLGVQDPEVLAAKSMIPPQGGFPDPVALFSREAEERWSAGGSYAVSLALAEIGPWTPKVFQIDLSRFGAGKADRVGAGPLKDAFDQAGRAMGVAAYELYLSRAVPTAAAAFPGEPPQVVLGTSVVEGATPMELRFLAARTMGMLRGGRGVLPLIGADDFRRLLVAAAMAGTDQAGAKVDAAQEAVTKALYKALPRKSRKELAPVALEVMARSADAPALHAAMINDANRVALVMCDQLAPAVDALGRMSGVVLHGVRDLAARARAMASHREITGLLAFAVGEQRQEMRRLVGLK
ncbi:MAG TPA: hypothetical protein VG389_09090 [Myxococcota bacterium]|nr:hypothetical protein [Myxococcota bacterium]